MEDAFYQVIESYKPEPEDTNGLAVEKNDIVHIFPSPDGWRGRAYAFNKYSRKRGFIPLDILKHMENHTLITHYVLNPLLCTHCCDYIWGTGKILMKCAGFSRPVSIIVLASGFLAVVDWILFQTFRRGDNEEFTRSSSKEPLKMPTAAVGETFETKSNRPRPKARKPIQ